MTSKTFNINSLNNWTLLGTILLLFFIVFRHLFSANFISWDDPEYVTANIDVVEFNFKNLITNFYVGNYHPLTMLNYGVDYLLFKNSPKGYHIENIIWHFLNVVALLLLCRKLKLQTIQIFFVLSVFAFHPLQLESIAWVSERKNLLYGFFFFIGLVQYFNYREKNQTKFLIFTYVFFVLSLLSKPSAVTFPIVIALVDYFIFKKSTKSILINCIGFIVFSIATGLITIYAQDEARFLLNSHSNYSFINKVGIFGYGLMHYILKFILPINLSAFYSYPDDVSSLVLPGILTVLLFISLITFIIYKKQYLVLLWLLFFFFNIILVLQIFPFGDAIAADRYMYIPIVGLALLIVYLLPKISNHLFFSLVIVVALSSASFARSALWKNSLPLFLNVLESNPNSFIANNSLGVEYMDKNDTTNAIKYLNKTIELYPKSYKAYYNRGLYFGKYKYYDKAILDLSKSIEISGYYKAYIARANAHYLLHNYKAAISDAQEVLKLDSQNYKALVVLANSYDDLNQLNDAMEFYNKAIYVNEKDPTIYLRRAILFGKLQQYDRCIFDLDKCISLNSNYGEAFYWRGVAKVNLNQNPCHDFQTGSTLGFDAAKQALQKFCK
jgi:tetratricopeptide (TPR) repeat protein